MTTYILKRLLFMVPMLVGITLASFFVMKLAPGTRGGGAASGDVAAGRLTKQQFEVMEDTFHIGQPMWKQYLYWLGVIQPELSRGQQRGWLNRKYRAWKETGVAPPMLSAEQMRQWESADKEAAPLPLPAGVTPQKIEQWMKELGEALPRRGLIYGDFGMSVATPSIPVSQKLEEALPITVLLSVIAILVTYLASIPLGIYSATHQGGRTDKGITVILFALYSLPSFWVAIMLIRWNLLLPKEWQLPIEGLFPSGAEDLPTLTLLWKCTQHIFLPVVCMCYGGLAGLSRFMRVGMIDVIRSDYIRTARAKGCSEQRVIYKHALRNSVIPILTMMAGLLPALIGGSFIIETIFGIPGMGYLGYTALLQRDYTLLMAELFLAAVLTLIGILISDILYVVVDPRISFEKAE